mmetsp:Transcript_32935/g.104279  ORF Transcript_32935/g.104279 Transcript_32935/m.104279 type:complete len:274 (+) Transcript_32935:896-1717(+)
MLHRHLHVLFELGHDGRAVLLGGLHGPQPLLRRRAPARGVDAHHLHLPAAAVAFVPAPQHRPDELLLRPQHVLPELAEEEGEVALPRRRSDALRVAAAAEGEDVVQLADLEAAALHVPEDADAVLEQAVPRVVVQQRPQAAQLQVHARRPHGGHHALRLVDVIHVAAGAQVARHHGLVRRHAGDLRVLKDAHRLGGEPVVDGLHVRAAARGEDEAVAILVHGDRRFAPAPQRRERAVHVPRRLEPHELALQIQCPKGVWVWVWVSVRERILLF